MKNEIVEKFAVASVLSLFGIIVISSTMLAYSTVLTSEISKYCLENLSLTGAINVVCAMLLDFRAYDTLGEILIIFVTISGVMLLVREKK
ncbi:MAG: hydrogen gas-evolving membrane-bound hydrogenase subunit E [Thermoplasmatota archaeon]|jgi:multisubunit Na+/H+ antiporter MnhB subunit